MVTSIPLTRGLVALVDDEDAERVLQFKWHAMPSRNTWYAARNIPNGKGRKPLRLHTFLMNPEPGMFVDHVDLDGLNCQRANLRHCTQSQNQANQPRCKANTSGFKGVTFHKRDGHWRAMIKVSGSRINLGGFANPNDAADAYDAACRRYFGDFARVNFPNEGERAA